MRTDIRTILPVLYDEENEQYFVSPFFDQGLCLLADTRQDYPMELSIEQCMDKIEAKPFSSEFDTQLEAAGRTVWNTAGISFYNPGYTSGTGRTGGFLSGRHPPARRTVDAPADAKIFLFDYEVNFIYRVAVR